MRRLAVIAACALLLAVSHSAAPAPAAAVRTTLDAESVFASVAQAIPFIETPVAAGSGILYDDEHVLTDAHVVWPFDTVHVRFPDGTDFPNAPVVAWDWLADFAVIRVGPVPGVHPLAITDAGPLRIGSDVYLIGYPGEIDRQPSPTIARGLVSRLRTGGPAKLTYIQTDAVAAGGVSGGAMVSSTGEVVGIMQLRFPDTNFALAASASQALARTQALLRFENIDGYGARQLDSLTAGARLSDSIVLQDAYDERAYLVRRATTGPVTITVDSEVATLIAYDPAGNTAARSTLPGGGQRSIEFRAVGGAPYVIVVGQADRNRNSYTVVANQPLAPIRDPDDGRVIRVGQAVKGNLDYVGDHDFFSVDLEKGQSITVTAESITIDALVLIAAADAKGPPLAFDDDSGGGLLGHDARVAFTAPATGRYVIGIGDSISNGRGGYLLTVYASAPPRGAAGVGRITGGVPPAVSAGLFIFGGGSSDELVAAGGCGRLARFWATRPDGQFVAYVPGSSVRAVNEAWEALFPYGIPANTSLFGICQPPG